MQPSTTGCGTLQLKYFGLILPILVAHCCYIGTIFIVNSICIPSVYQKSRSEGIESSYQKMYQKIQEIRLQLCFWSAYS